MSKNGYWLIRIDGTPEQVEIFVALTSEMGFEGYEMVHDGCEAYTSVDTADRDFFVQLQNLTGRLNLRMKTHFLAARNWNASWEAHFEPIVVEGRMLVKAPFHTVKESYPYTLIIKPRMAFGTGHHETTYMMLHSIMDFPWAGQSVLDYGSGTAILSVAARMMGSGKVTAVDIQPEALANAQEHIRLNEIDGVELYTGDLSVVPPILYEVILANINRKVILETLPDLYDLLSPEGTLFVSGILKSDSKLVLRRARDAGFHLLSRMERGNWICCQFGK